MVRDPRSAQVGVLAVSDERKFCPSCRWFAFNPYGEDHCARSEGRHVTGAPYRLVYLRSEEGPCGPEGRLYEPREKPVAGEPEGWPFIVFVIAVIITFIVAIFHG